MSRPPEPAPRPLWDRAPFAFIAAATAVSALIVDPRGNFPLNDDWAYASAVRHLLADHKLVLSDWTAPLAVPHVLAGWGLAGIFGFGYGVLRFGTCVWAAIGVWFLDRILKHENVPVRVRILAAATLLFSPIYFVMSFTFHTDVTFLALALGAIHFFQRADDGGAASDEWLAGLFSLAAALTRQIGLALPLAATIWLLWQRRATAARLCRIWLLPAVGFGAFYYWFVHVHGPTWVHAVYVTHGTLRHALEGKDFFIDTARRTADSLLYAALFAAAFAFLRPKQKTAASFPRTALSVGAAIAIGAYLLARGLWPYFENVFYRGGLGPLTVSGAARGRPESWWSASGLWSVYTVGAGAALWTAVRRAAAGPWTQGEKRLALLAGLPALATLAGERYFDRYTLEWIAPAVILFALRLREARVSFAAWFVCAFWAALCLAGTRDYFAWNRAKWDLGTRAARELNCAPGEVLNGFDWNAEWTYEPNMATLKSRKPLTEIGEWEWMALTPPRALVTYASEGPALDEQKYGSPLAPRGATLRVVDRRAGP